MITPGCYTALITPFTENGEIDWVDLGKLIAFQIENGVTGLLAVGTTGESPTLKWGEHMAIIHFIAEKINDKCLCIAGTGSNNTAETLKATAHATEAGADAVLLVDPYYNGPSSLEIRQEYIEPVAKAFPEIDIIPYIIPGRTGCQLLPEDLAILAKKHSNVRAVKEATGNLKNMRRTRECCGSNYLVLSGDDGNTLQIITDPEIEAGGVISVMSNIAPAAVTKMIKKALAGDLKGAEKIHDALSPLFDIVTVKTTEATSFGDVPCRARNPLPIKTLMRILGMPAGPCRRPLGKMTKNGITVVLEAARTVNAKNPEILKPAAEFFGIDINERLNQPLESWEKLAYESYK